MHRLDGRVHMRVGGDFSIWCSDQSEVLDVARDGPSTQRPGGDPDGVVAVARVVEDDEASLAERLVEEPNVAVREQDRATVVADE